MPSTDRNSSGMCEAPASATWATAPSDANESRTDRRGEWAVGLNMGLCIKGVDGVSVVFTGGLGGAGAGT